MKFLIFVFCAMVAAAAAAPARADAYGRESGFRPYIQGQAQGRAQEPVRRRGAEQAVPQRGVRGAEKAERDRMSEEERRQLRRDIRDAGRDLYRPERQAPAERRRGGRW